MTSIPKVRVFDRSSMGGSSSKVKPIPKRAHLCYLQDPYGKNPSHDIVESQDISANSITSITEQCGGICTQVRSYPEGTHEVKGLRICGIPDFPRYLLQKYHSIILIIACKSSPVIQEHTRPPTEHELLQTEATFPISQLPGQTTEQKQLHIHSDGTFGFQKENLQ